MFIRRVLHALIIRPFVRTFARRLLVHGDVPVTVNVWPVELRPV